MCGDGRAARMFFARYATIGGRTAARIPSWGWATRAGKEGSEIDVDCSDVRRVWIVASDRQRDVHPASGRRGTYRSTWAGLGWNWGGRRWCLVAGQAVERRSPRVGPHRARCVDRRIPVGIRIEITDLYSSLPFSPVPPRTTGPHALFDPEAGIQPPSSRRSSPPPATHRSPRSRVDAGLPVDWTRSLDLTDWKKAAATSTMTRRAGGRA